MKKYAFLAAAALFTFGCGAADQAEVKNTTNTAPAANTQTQTEPVEIPVFTNGANPKDDVISSTGKLQESKFWTATVTSESNEALAATMQYAAPDRFHIKKADGEVIVIGSDSFINENGKWEKIDDDLGEMIKSQTQNATAEAVKTLKDVQIVGKEKLNGRDVTVYSHKNGDITTRVWIANDTGMQLKNEIEATIEGRTQKQTTVYDYDKPVKIEAPKLD